MEQINSGNFSLLSFYAKRIRRIIPTLTLVLFSVFLFGWWTLFAVEYKELGLQILASTTFSSNFLLMTQGGYFDEKSELKPLMHLWSLAIEEQFYIVWPLIMLFLSRQRAVLWASISLFVISFFFCFFLTYTKPISAFYLPLARVWELSVGAAVYSLKGDFWSLRTEKTNNYLSFLGISLILVEFILIDEKSHFPGWVSLFPCFGAALLIFSGDQTIVAKKILSFDVLVFIGLISYALYLWHWPLLSFAYIIYGHQPPPLDRFMLVLLSVVLAIGSLFIIEKPIRQTKGRISVVLLLILFVVIGFIGYNTYARDGYEFRSFKSQILKTGEIGSTAMFEKMKADYFPCENKLILEKSPIASGIKRCFQSKKDRAIDFLIIGDSHAEQLFLGLAKNLSNLNVAYFSQDTIPILSKMDYSDIFRSIKNESSIKQVIVAGYWPGRISEIPKGRSLYDELKYSFQSLDRSDLKIYLIWGLPNFSFDPRECKYLRFGGRNKCEEGLGYSSAQEERYKQDILRLSSEFKTLSALNVSKYFCDDELCSMVEGDALLFRDNHHLSIYGSDYLVKKLLLDEAFLVDSSR
jgi:peptidoglycan/LPS O-acetylase OafA/YrhL